MKEQYITITGIKHYYGIIPFEIGRKITCVKEPDNYYDQEAIRCQVKHIGTVGYVHIRLKRNLKYKSCLWQAIM